MNADPDGGGLIIIGEYLGSIVSNISVTVNGQACLDIEVLSADAVLQCTYPAGTGFGLPVLVEVRDANEDPSQWLSLPSLFGYAEEEAQGVIIADITLLEPALVDVNRFERAITARLLSVDTIAAPVTAYVVGTGAGRSFDGELLRPFHTAIQTTIDQRIAPSQAAAIHAALDSSLAIWVRDAVGVDANVTRIMQQNTSIYCPAGEERVGAEGTYVCQECAQQYAQPYPSVHGEPCVQCDDFQLNSAGLSCTGGTTLPVPYPGYWRNIRAATDVARNPHSVSDFAKFAVHRCSWTSHPVCVGGINSSCVEGHDPAQPLCAICEDGWHMYGGRCEQCNTNEAFVKAGVMVCFIAAVFVLFVVSVCFVLRTAITFQGLSPVLRPETDDDAPAPRGELSATSKEGHEHSDEGVTVPQDAGSIAIAAPLCPLCAPQGKCFSAACPGVSLVCQGASCKRPTLRACMSFSFPGFSTKLKILISFLVRGEHLLSQPSECAKH